MNAINWLLGLWKHISVLERGIAVAMTVFFVS